MTPNEETRQDAGRLSPVGWIVIGAFIVLIGAFVTVGTGDPGWLVIASIPGGVMLWIGVIAKGVEVGLRIARREE
jgi:hypothetical protein